jgi:hypothetical protein
VTGREALAVTVFVAVTARRAYRGKLKQRYVDGFMDGENFRDGLAAAPPAPVVRLRVVKPDAS